ncbi:uncharacterized protein LOC128951862 [Oppia nitens]|uniref:uncharacterized protein LOC128951862 n=1 Tax=Oppia nitens TaxID=1686743 RepID=UPI0023DBC1CA|nr:uncharacterized protein LOC128951862 [Oppia nitens]
MGSVIVVNNNSYIIVTIAMLSMLLLTIETSTITTTTTPTPSPSPTPTPQVYQTYNLYDICSQRNVNQIQLKVNENKGSVIPAILYLLVNDNVSQVNANQTTPTKTTTPITDCAIRLTIGSAIQWPKSNGFIVGIDDLLMGDRDSIEIVGSDHMVINWSKNNTNSSGVAYGVVKGAVFNGTDFLDIRFRSDNLFNTIRLQLIITPFEEPLFDYCLSTDDSKCLVNNSSKQCIPRSLRCDGHRNCANGDDEINCGDNDDQYTTILPQNTTTTTGDDNYNNNTDTIDTDLSLKNTTYNEYNLKKICQNSSSTVNGINGIINLSSTGSTGTNNNSTNIPAIIYLLADDNKNLSLTNCTIRFVTPSKKGLLLGVDSLAIGTGDYLAIGSGDKQQREVDWFHNSTGSQVGLAFKTNVQIVDLTFHGGNASNSSFSLIMTPYDVPIMGYCFSTSNLKCRTPYGDDYQCVSKQYQCDGHRNCANGEDESKCPRPVPSTTTTPPTPTTTTTTPEPKPTTSTSPKPSTTTTTAAPTPKPTTKPGPTPAPSPTPSPSTLSGGQIAGIVIGVLIAALLLVFIVYKVVKKRQNGGINSGYSPVNDN